MPIRQFFYFDAIECLPENVFQDPAESYTPTLPSTKSRYYSQEIVFGVDFQEKICKSKYFVVSALRLILKIVLHRFDNRLDLVRLVAKC
jgi:ubiquitin-activating enzyme E1